MAPVGASVGEWWSPKLHLGGRKMAALPRVTVEKLVREAMPQGLSLSKEAVDWAAESATDFVRMLGENANAVAERGAKKEKYRVNADHVVKALQEMGKEDYVKAMQADDGEDAVKYKKRRVASRKAALNSASHEELLAEQNALFKEASAHAARQGW